MSKFWWTRAHEDVKCYTTPPYLLGCTQEDHYPLQIWSFLENINIHASFNLHGNMLIEQEFYWKGKEWEQCTAWSCPETEARTYRSGTAKVSQIPEFIIIGVRNRRAVTEEYKTGPYPVCYNWENTFFRQLSWLWQKSQQTAKHISRKINLGCGDQQLKGLEIKQNERSE